MNLNGKKSRANVYRNEMWIKFSMYRLLGETFALRKTNAMIQVRSNIELGGVLTAFIRAISLCQLPLPSTHLTLAAKH